LSCHKCPVDCRNPCFIVDIAILTPSLSNPLI
jgi:hypothetical protein